MRIRYWLLALLLCLGLTACEGEASLAEMDIGILKIGKADAIILRIGEHTVLIDTGEEEDGEEILDYLTARGVESVDYLIITHFDKDHIGGAPDVLKGVHVKQILQPDYPKDSQVYLDYQNAVKQQNVVLNKVTDPVTFTLAGAVFTVDPPKRISEDGEDNANSLVITVQHGDNSFLLAGDATEPRLDELLEQGNLHSDVLKVPHHGKLEDNSDAFFQAVNPKIAVITCSDKNPPDEEVVELLEGLGAAVLLTSNGDILLTSDGQTIVYNQ